MSLCYSVFEKIIYQRCRGNIDVIDNEGNIKKRKITMQYLDSQVLLISGMDADETEQFKYGNANGKAIKEDVLCTFRKGRELFPWIIQAYEGKDRKQLETKVFDHFKNELLPFLNNERLEDIKNTLWSVISKDEEIPQSEVARLDEAFKHDPALMFIAKCFIISVIKNTLKPDYRPNGSILEVISELEAGHTPFILNGLIEELYHYAVEGADIFDLIKYYQNDIIYFAEKMVPFLDKLDKKHFELYSEIRLRAIEYEMNNELWAGISNICNGLFEKYGLGKKDYEATKIHLSNNGNDLELYFKQRYLGHPVVVSRASDLLSARTPEDFAKIMGVPLDEWERHGLDINEPIFEYLADKSPDDFSIFKNLDSEIEKIVKNREKSDDSNTNN